MFDDVVITADGKKHEWRAIERELDDGRAHDLGFTGARTDDTVEGTDSGSFIVTEQRIEYQETTADLALLRQMALMVRRLPANR